MRLTEQASVDNPVFNQQISSIQSLLHLNTHSAHALFDFTVNSQSAMMGLDDIAYISAIIFMLIVPLIWITHPAKGGGADAGAGAH
jgi:MFS transporter, DHA2 family, multidrug resistance protein